MMKADDRGIIGFSTAVRKILNGGVIVFFGKSDMLYLQPAS
jgi:hypothetical protein